MLIVRPVRADDLDRLYELSASVTVGLTTLPHNREVLKKRIEESVHSFDRIPKKPKGDVYLFVMEDTETQRLVGTTALFGKVGGYLPFYTYVIQQERVKSKSLQVDKEIQYLQLKEDHNGPSEIGTLFLKPEYRKNGNGRLLSLSRFLFMSQYPHCFEEEVVAEMRGVFDKDGRSPFWEALGKHFFEIDFEKADLMVMQDKTFIAELIPRHPIYIPMLTYQAQKVIGEVHEDTKGARHMLESEGFKFKGEVDIFEGGPVLTAMVKDIRVVKESREVQVSEISDGQVKGPIMMAASNKSFDQFNIGLGQIQVQDKDRASLSRELAAAINVKKGDIVRIAGLRA